ncbi:MAG TPA: hypothetical protein PLG77_13370, partial [Burkholderiaceae bacterium]|nr:hypothetical protein [Burkholderiaceae bacterium]
AHLIEPCDEVAEAVAAAGFECGGIESAPSRGAARAGREGDFATVYSAMQSKFQAFVSGAVLALIVGWVL